METIRHWLAHGAVKRGGTWGGVECKDFVSPTVHICEDLFWNFIIFTIFFSFDLFDYLRRLSNDIKQNLQKHPTNSFTRSFELVFAFIHFTLYGMVFYYKTNIHALIMVLQPCPMIVLLQGIALLDNGVRGVMITIFILPALVGALLATAIPDTSGLDQPFETEAYYIQHYSILIMPFLLLSRQNFLALKFANLRSILTGLLILIFLHFSFFEVIDWILLVNVEFMLCPTNSMTEIFNVIEGPLRLLLFPSHRSTLCLVTILAVWPLCYFYVSGAHCIKFVFGTKFTTQKTRIN